MAMAPAIRAATAAEADAIRRLVRAQPRMNPTGLDWRNFVIAAAPDGRVVGCVQLRPAGPDAVELGSLVVHPEHRGRRLAARLVAAILARTEARVLVVTAAAHARHYAPWGFRRIAARHAPPRVAVNYLIGQSASGLRILQGQRPRRMAILERPPGGAGP
jgi:N-acetylglutamate synthase-like GNAT family acetyltransferase